MGMTEKDQQEWDRPLAEKMNSLIKLLRESYGEMNTYKENLLQNARYQVEKAGGKVMVRGQGNKRHVSFYTADGRCFVVWYPTESRVNDLEVADLKEAIKEASGQSAFTM